LWLLKNDWLFGFDAFWELQDFQPNSTVDVWNTNVKILSDVEPDVYSPFVLVKYSFKADMVFMAIVYLVQWESIQDLADSHVLDREILLGKNKHVWVRVQYTALLTIVLVLNKVLADDWMRVHFKI